MSSSPPTTLGKYQIIREIARSNDIVYEAYDPLMNRRVAIKELSMPSGANATQKEDRIRRFLREARAVGSLTHPNIMTVFEVGEDGGRHFIAMEYLDGHTLRNELDTKGFIPPDDAIDIAVKVLSALEYAHSKGVIHRDIKPDNIQILSDGTIKLTDFGIARLTFEPNLTMDGQVFGTPSYMSPEQVVGRDIDARSDLFSVGIVLYEMIAGQKPFGGDSVVSITYAIMNKDPERPNQANFAVWQVLEKALDKSPQLRYRNAQEMSDALRNAQKAVGPGGVIDPGRPQIGGTVIQPSPYPYGNQGPVYPQAPMPMNPYGQQPAPPPVVYPYNPYQQPGAGQIAPHTPSYAPQPFPNPNVMPPGYTQAPIYYPPPPRQPLLKPETRFFIGRLLLAVTLIGMLVGFFVVAVPTLSKLFGERQPAVNSRPASVPDPYDAQISQAEKDFNAATTQAEKDAKQKALAAIEEQAGISQMRQGNSDAGEQNLSDSLARDPNRHDAAVTLAQHYDQQAATATDPSTKIQFLQQAADSWAKAAESAVDPQQASQQKVQAASAYYDLGAALADAGNKESARKALYTGEKFAPTNSDIAKQIENLLSQLTKPSN